MTKKPIYSVLAGKFQAYLNCIRGGNREWEGHHKDGIVDLVKNRFPSGSGFDSGTHFDFEKSKPERLVFVTSFHHMDEHGFYDGWTHHEVIVTPSLVFGFNIRVTGKDRNQIKDYIAECFNNCLSELEAP